MQKVATVIQNEERGMKARDLVLGIAMPEASRAYPVPLLKQSGLVNDRLGGAHILLVVGPDNESLRVFRTDATDFYRLPATTGEALMIDTASGSKWNFRGCAVEGTAKGKCLTPVDALQDYWFDWRQYHPGTTILAGPLGTSLASRSDRNPDLQTT